MNVPHTLSRRALLALATTGAAMWAAGLGGCVSGDADDLDGTPATDQYGDSEVLVDALWLAQRLDDPALRVIDCSPIRAYRNGHLPGATHVWWQDTIEINNPIYGMLAGMEKRRSIIRDAGIDPDSTVVVYDDAGGTYAARVLWMLHMTNFQRVALLDGGRQAWERAGMGLTREVSQARDGTWEGIAVEDANAHAHDIQEWIQRDDVAILDTRSEKETRETWHGRLRAGTIPGSAWLPRDRFHGEPGSPFLAPRADLVSRLAAAGIGQDAQEVVVYGLHSTLAALPYVALLALGIPRVRVYNGSWAEWGASDRPIAPL